MNESKKLKLLTLAIGALASHALLGSPASTAEVKLSSEIVWQKLNPARGDQSPQAGTIWGDRKGEVATGFLAKFVDGFSSPPHIHNVTYRGVVISGLIHNDDPDAAEMWMPPGSYWTQPKGEAHITAAKGENNIAYIEIESGPYLVKPTDQSFDSGERPVNIDPANIVWLGKSDSNWVKQPETQIAHLWGDSQDNQLNGSMIKLPSGFKGSINGQGTSLRVVVIQGQVNYEATNQTLTPGASFRSTGKHKHPIQATQDTILYIRANGKYLVK